MIYKYRENKKIKNNFKKNENVITILIKYVPLYGWVVETYISVRKITHLISG